MNVPLQGYSGLAEALAQAAAGDERAFRAIYDHLADRLFSYARSRSREREDALDIVQDIFLDVWGALPRFRYISDAHFYGFVFTIAKRRLIRHYKTKRHESLDDLEPSQMPHVDADVFDPDGMKDLVEELPEKYKDVIVLRYWSGLSFAEIGELLDTTETNAKVRHHRALKELRAIMKRHE